MTRAKICGLTRRVDAEVAERAGASFLGVILASGPRLVDIVTAREVLGPRRHTVRRVAVFGGQSIGEILSVAESLDLDVIQLHGDPSPSQVSALREATSRAVWPVLRVEGTVLPANAQALAEAAGALVLDAKVVGQLGGTGTALDWEGLADAVKQLRAAVPDFEFVLAGGLRAQNVAYAMALLEPDVVDVSSGVETAPGVKDPVAVEAFVTAVSAAKRTTG